MRLGLNIDHIAYLRETRKINDPDPLEAIFIAKRAGASQITIHLREDRRHINEYDLRRIIESSFLPVNVECSTNSEIVSIVSNLKPHRITLVPENRNEVTTEGGLALKDSILPLLESILNKDIAIALFIDPSKDSINKSILFKNALNGGHIGIELHTGKYANLSLMLDSNLVRTHNSIKEYAEYSREKLANLIKQELELINKYANIALEAGIEVYAGHGLNYHNIESILKCKAISELNIGQSIIARSIYTGLERAILDMVEIIKRGVSE